MLILFGIIAVLAIVVMVILNKVADWGVKRTQSQANIGRGVQFGAILFLAFILIVGALFVGHSSSTQSTSQPSPNRPPITVPQPRSEIPIDVPQSAPNRPPITVTPAPGEFPADPNA